MVDRFLSLKGYSEGFLKVKGSRFLAYAWPVSSVEEIESLLAEKRKVHWDSRHVCFAWRLGPEGKSWRAYDAGEPSHSAGDPILNALRSFDLTNCLAVVVRYFGGTKLGISGLVEAYRTATEDAIQNNEIIERHITRLLEIRYPYEKTAEVNRLVHQFNLKASHSEYGADCLQGFEIRLSRFDQIKGMFADLGIIFTDR